MANVWLKPHIGQRRVRGVVEHVALAQDLIMVGDVCIGYLGHHEQCKFVIPRYQPPDIMRDVVAVCTEARRALGKWVPSGEVSMPTADWQAKVDEYFRRQREIEDTEDEDDGD